MTIFRAFGFGDHRKKEGNEKASPASSRGRAAFGGFLQSGVEILKKEKKKGCDRAFQPAGERPPVYRGPLRVEELEPKISP